jgi:hypothetical protein
MDFLYVTEGVELLRYGVEGVYFHFEEDWAAFSARWYATRGKEMTEERSR